MAAPHDTHPDDGVPRRLGFFRHTARAVYGTIIACAVVASAADFEEDWGSGNFLVTMISAAVVLWIAGIYALILADTSTDPFRVRLARAADDELAVLQSVVPVSVPLILGMLGVLSEDQAVYGSLIVGVGALATWGALAARQRGSHPVMVAGAALFSALIGMIIIILKTWG